MNELTTTTQQLPDTLEDLTQYVLVNKAKLQAYMLKLKTVEKLDVAQAIKDQTLKDSQEIASALLAAEQRIGELLLAIPKASGGDRKSEGFKNRDMSNFEKSKSETIKDMGYSKDEVSDYQQMAKNPEVVQKVIDDAIANGEVPTKSEVTKNIKFQKQLETIESKASEPLKEQVKAGQKTINQAYLEIKEKERKQADLSAKAHLEAAKERNEDFKQQKTVTIEEAKQNIEDLAEIASSKIREIRNALKGILFMGAMVSGNDFDLSELEKNAHSYEFRELVQDLDFATEIISKIQEAILSKR